MARTKVLLVLLVFISIFLNIKCTDFFNFQTYPKQVSLKDNMK